MTASYQPASGSPMNEYKHTPPAGVVPGPENNDHIFLPSEVTLEQPNPAELPPFQAMGRPRHDTVRSISTVTGSSSNTTPTADDSRVSSPLTTATDFSFSSQTQPATLANPWPSLNPLTAYYTPGDVQTDEPPLRMDVDSSSRAGSVSIDDPDVRMAAEALGDLRADFVSSPPHHSTPRAATGSSSRSSSSSNPEPLLSLLTTSHPLLAKTIEGTTSAYNSSKNFSPRFKSGAEYVEGYLTPLGNTLGSVSRATGVAGGVRWFLGGGRRHRQHQQQSRHPSTDSNTSELAKYYKRRKMRERKAGDGTLSTPHKSPYASGTASPKTDGHGENLFAAREERRSSMSTVETLPEYDDMKAPEYAESAEGSVDMDDSLSATTETENQLQHNDRQHVSRRPAPWQSRLIMSTSGLSIAMSDESLCSLKYCLHWLRWANDRIDNVITALKAAVDQYDETHLPSSRNDTAASEGQAGTGHSSGPSAGAASDPQKGERSAGTSDGEGGGGNGGDGSSSSSEQDMSEAARNELAARVETLRGDVLHTLKGVVDTVSKYAGGALPENARVLVRRHLTSLPQRFRLASLEAEAEAGAQKDGGKEGGTGETAGTKRLSDKEVREGAQRVLVLAKEGLDMMSQVSGVLDDTIVSAEEWCERLGKLKGKRKSKAVEGQELEETRGSEETPTTPTAAGVRGGTDGDISMQQ